PGRLLARCPRRAAAATEPLAPRRAVAGAPGCAAPPVDRVAGSLGGRVGARAVTRAVRPVGAVRLGRSPAAPALRSGPVDLVFGAIRAFRVAGCHYAVILPHAL